MNRQAAAFLSLFSLVLILGVLYVTSPAEDLQVFEQQTLPADTQAAGTIDKETKILADDTISASAKSEALQKLESQNAEDSDLAELKAYLQKAKQEADVTINEKTIRITLKNQKAEEKTAAEIIQEAYKLTKHKYFIEVAFQEK